mgnify:CR=1 FL=1
MTLNQPLIILQGFAHKHMTNYLINKLAKALSNSECASCCMDVKSEQRKIAKCAIEEFTKILNERMAKFEKQTLKEHIAFMKDRTDDGDEIDMDLEPADDRENTIWEQGQRKGIEQVIQLINKITK